MPHCAVCDCETLTDNKKDILLDRVGDPPELLSDLLVRITIDVEYEFSSTDVCIKCSNKIAQYYAAIQVAEQIKLDILKLIRKDPALEYDNICEEECIENIESTEIVCPTEIQDQIEDEKVVEQYVFEKNVTKSSKNVATKKMRSIKKTADPSVEKGDAEGIKDETFDCSDSKGISMYHSSGIGQPIGIQCEVCDRVFKYARTFHAHKKYNGFVGYICEICGIQCLTKAGIKDHAKVHKPDKEFQCTQCDAQFHRKFLLKQHMAYHTNETPFQCEICSKSFVHRVALNVHKKIHTDQIRRFNCQICEKKFRSVTHLRRHMAIHTGAKPFSCPICSNRFSQAYNMKAHMKLHTDPKANTKKQKGKTVPNE